MAWVHVGPHKINTALVCYVEEDGDTVRLYFHGEWEGNPLDLHFDEAKAFWRHLKAENVMITKDKGSAAVLPRALSEKMVDVPTTKTTDLKPIPTATPTSSSRSSSGHSSSHGSSSTSSSSSSHSPRPAETSHRSGDHKRH